MNGKNRCRILKEIRKRIADENGIEFVTSECKYKGDCLGTCPKCESEVQYLERELRKKRSLGKRVAIAGIAAGITLSASGCTEDIKNKLGLGTELQGDMPAPSYDESSEYCETMGEERPEDSKVSDIVDGEIVEVVGEMPDSSGACSSEWEHTDGILMPEPPEITNPYDDIKGDLAVMQYDINDFATMKNDEAYELIKDWNRKYIDYEWQEYIDHRQWRMSSFLVSGVAVIEVYFDEQGTVESVNIYPAYELMGDMEIEE